MGQRRMGVRDKCYSRKALHVGTHSGRPVPPGKMSFSVHKVKTVGFRSIAEYLHLKFVTQDYCNGQF